MPDTWAEQEAERLASDQGEEGFIHDFDCEQLHIGLGLPCSCWISEHRKAITAALERAARRERAACHDIAVSCARERAQTAVSARAAGGHVDAVIAKQSEAERIAQAIAARGPVEEP